MDPIYDFKIVDRLAHAYGWTIEYISSLEINEIHNLLRVIEERERVERRAQSFIMALAACGKTLDDVIKKNTKENVSTDSNVQQTPQKTNLSSDEESNMIKMFQSLGMTHDAVIDGLKKGKLEI